MRHLLLLLILIASHPALAQDVRTVECRFLGFGMCEDNFNVLTTGGDGVEITCPISTTQISKKFTCSPKADQLVFLNSDDRKPLATATVPARIRSALLVFIKMASTKPDSTQWKVFVIEDSEKNFPDGGAYIANFYNDDIRFVIGEHKGMLHAAGAYGYGMPKERDTFNMAPVIFEFLNGEKWRIANESSLRFLPGMRYLIFAYVDPVSGRPKIKTYQDIAEPRKPAAKP